jgi:hypothetical protein
VKGAVEVVGEIRLGAHRLVVGAEEEVVPIRQAERRPGAARSSVSTCRFRGPSFVLLRDPSGGRDEEDAMKYVMLIYQGDAQERQAELPEEEQKQVSADYQGIKQTPGVTPGVPMGLPENATTVRVEGGKTLTTDGPFVGMKEAVGGWFVLEADNLDAAIEVAARHPAARYGGAVEIRPSEVYW